jgi:hypothetical protein
MAASNADYSNKASKGRSAPKIQNSFVLTARRGAAMLANLEKARAAPRTESIVTKKRCAANLFNLQKADAVCRSTADKTSRSKPECPLDSDSLSSRLYDQSRIGTPRQEVPARKAREGVAQSPGAHPESAVADPESPQLEHGSANLSNLQKAKRRLAEHRGQGLPIKAGMSFRFRLIELATTRSVKDWDPETRSSGSGGGEGVAQSPGGYPKSAVTDPESPQLEHSPAASWQSFVSPDVPLLGSSRTAA